MNDSIKEINEILGIKKDVKELGFEEEFKLYIYFSRKVYFFFLKEKDPDEFRFKIGNVIVDLMKKGFDFEKYEDFKDKNFYTQHLEKRNEILEETVSRLKRDIEGLKRSFNEVNKGKI